MQKDLFELNFNELLKYPVNFGYANKYDPALSCSGFCIACENEFQRTAEGTLMSHGCSSEEIKKILKQKDFTGGNDTRIMFLLENPGGDYDNGEKVTYKGITKKPPVKHFYFSPDMESNKWPETIDEINVNPYGNYFAYLINKYKLNNVYITNCIKCKYCDAMYEKSKDICVETYLKREVELFKPEKIVFFGHNAENIFKEYFSGFSGKTCYAWHPATRRARQCIVDHNDEILKDFL